MYECLCKSVNLYSRKLMTCAQYLCCKNLKRYPGPSEIFLEVFLQEGERVSGKASRRERKPSGYLGLESHFHTDDRVRI